MYISYFQEIEARAIMPIPLYKLCSAEQGLYSEVNSREKLHETTATEKKKSALLSKTVISPVAAIRAYQFPGTADGDGLAYHGQKQG